jgi:hypothetical protein
MRRAPVLLSIVACAACARQERCRLDMPTVQEPARAPFTVEQIRSAMRVGRKDRFLVVRPAVPPSFRDVEIRSAKEDAYSIDTATTNVPVGWTVGGEATIRIRPPPPATWLEVMGHARYFDRAHTTIHAAPCDTALGRVDCMIYTWSGGEVVIRSFYAKNLPGPPVLTTVSACRELVEMVALVHHEDGPTGP